MEEKNDIFLLGLHKMAETSYFKSLTGSFPHKMIIVDAETFRIQFSNHNPLDIDDKEVIGKALFDFIWPEYKALYLEKLEFVKQHLLSTTLEIKGASYNSPGGEAWYRSYITPLVDENNVIYSFLLIAENITEIKENELEIINKSEKIKAILNNTNDVICSIDLNYNITEFNVVFSNIIKLGYGIDLEEGMPVLNFIDPQKHEKLKAIYQKVAEGQILADIESFNTSRGLRFNETNYHPIYNFNKEIVGINIFSKDITNKKIDQEKIQGALREKEILLAEIHHRIKNNLAIVSSMLQLQEMNITNSEAKEALRVSRNRIKSTALVHELLYKNDSFQHIFLHDYLNQLFNNLRSDSNKSIAIKGEQVSINLEKAMPLGLLLNELMLNSFKHSYIVGEEGKISVCINTDSNRLILEYGDCKGNFSKEVDFYSPKTTGLLLIHTFIQQLDGEINLVENNPPKYIVNIPLYES